MAPTFKPEFDLPATMSRDIGRLIVRYAYLEHYVQRTIYTLVGVSSGIGRLAVREPGRLTDKFDLLLDLIAARGLRCPDDMNVSELREGIDDIMDMRNLCAHSTWTWNQEHQAWAVFITRGQALRRRSEHEGARGYFPKGK